MRLGFSPRSRVFVTLVPIVFLLLVTYPYFRSFSPSADNFPFFDNGLEEHDQPSSEDLPPLTSAPAYDSPFLTPGGGQADNLESHPHVSVDDPEVSSPDLPPDYDINEDDLLPSGLATTPTPKPKPKPKVAPVPPPPSPSDGSTTGKSSDDPDSPFVPFSYPQSFGNHPIDYLVQAGIKAFEKLKKKETKSLEAAAAAYRERRGRHPPPGFDQWYQFAKSKESVFIEEFFDPIYEDLEPFWALAPHDLRKTTPTWSNIVSIRKGFVTQIAHDGSHQWLEAWADTLRPIAPYLPDVDLAFNTFDEPRVVVPWKDIDRHMSEARLHRNLDKPQNLVTQYQVLQPLDFNNIPNDTLKEWHNTVPYWTFAREACHPDTPAHGTNLLSNFSLPPEFPHVFAEESYQGFVANWTFSKSVCLNPHLRNLHGNFINLLITSVNTTLFPIFSGSKHQSINNDIRIPAAKYWSSSPYFGGDQDYSTVDYDEDSRYANETYADITWDEKDSKVYWRGAATGGDHDYSNWRAFHRHRFVSMLNSTEVTMTEQKLDNLTSLEGSSMLEADPPLPHNFPFPNTRLYPLTALSNHPTNLGAWLEPMTDASFTHLMCHPQHLTTFGKGIKCRYSDFFYHVLEMSPFNESFMHKYLPDVDGNGYSGRYRAFLRSTSLPIKATVHSEWHDTRIVPWAHFVPMDNTFVDLYSIIEYFAGNPENDSDGSISSWFLEWFGWHSGGHDGGGTHGHRTTNNGHDRLARAIAEQGKYWADKVLRKEDMVVYMHRLVLEWARLNNDDRDKMGWAEDLKSPNHNHFGSDNDVEEGKSKEDNTKAQDQDHTEENGQEEEEHGQEDPQDQSDEDNAEEGEDKDDADSAEDAEDQADEDISEDNPGDEHDLIDGEEEDDNTQDQDNQDDGQYGSSRS